MPTRRPKSKNKRKRSSALRSKVPLLLLECDSQKLQEQSLSMVDDIHSFVKSYFPYIGREIVRTSSLNQLLRDLAQLATKPTHFDLILVIGHSNRCGLCLARDTDYAWNDVASWIEPFRPRYLIFAACEAGRFHAVQQLFAGISTLKEIYAPVFTTSKQQAEITKWLIPIVLGQGKNRSDLIGLVQAANFALTNGSYCRWTRTEFTRGRITGARQFDVAVELLDRFLFSGR